MGNNIASVSVSYAANGSSTKVNELGIATGEQFNISDAVAEVM